MIKEIKYNGYSANPSDYECADGDLSVAMNLIHSKASMFIHSPTREKSDIHTQHLGI